MHYSQQFCKNPKQYVVTGKQKNNFNGKFKLELVKTYHLGFVVKVLQKCCEHITFQKLPKQINQPKISNQMFNCDFLNFVFK